MNPYLIHQHCAQETDGRLALLRHAPKRIALVGADGDVSHALLAARYPQARFWEYDHRPQWLTDAANQRKRGWLRRNRRITSICQPITAALPEASADMLWANLSLIHAPDIVPVLTNWAQALTADGLLFFSHFGRDTLSEIRSLLTEHGITCTAPMWVDMHDLGDMLFHHGFYDPVVDTAQMVLTYQHAETFWQDMNTLGLWQTLHTSDPHAAKQIINQAWQTGQLSQITLETIFAHAIKRMVLPEHEHAIQFYPQKKNK